MASSPSDAHNGDPELILWLLAEGAAANAPRQAGTTASIHYAIDGCSELSAMMALVEAGASVEATDQQGDRPATGGEEASSRPQIPSRARCRHGRRQSEAGASHALRVCNDAVGCPMAAHEARCALDGPPAKMSDARGGFLPVHCAAENFALDTLRYLRSQGCRLDAKTAEGKEGLSPLELIEGREDDPDPPPLGKLGRRIANWIRSELGMEQRWDETEGGESDDEDEESSMSA